MYVLTANLAGLTDFTPVQIATAAQQFATPKAAYAAARFLSRSIGRTVTIEPVEESEPEAPLNEQVFSVPVRVVNDDPCDQCGFGNCIGHAWYVSH